MYAPLLALALTAPSVGQCPTGQCPVGYGYAPVAQYQAPPVQYSGGSCSGSHAMQGYMMMPQQAPFYGGYQAPTVPVIPYGAPPQFSAPPIQPVAPPSTYNAGYYMPPPAVYSYEPAYYGSGYAYQRNGPLGRPREISYGYSAGPCPGGICPR